jgi:creatinine amidohydrolase
MRALESRVRYLLAILIGVAVLGAQTNPLWHEQKTKNFLPDMTWPEVQDLLTRTDMVILPVTSLEQHGPQLPIGTDYFIGIEEAKLIAQKNRCSGRAHPATRHFAVPHGISGDHRVIA